MRTIMLSHTLLLVLLLTGITAAQTSTNSTDAPGLTVIKQGWRYMTISSGEVKSNDPLQPSLDRAADERKLREFQEKNIPPILQAKEATMPAGKPSIVIQYTFEAHVRNTAPKQILLVVWDYVFLDPTTGREIGYRTFTNQVKIGSGKDAKLVGVVTPPVINLKDAIQTARQLHGKFVEQIRIRRLAYDDNSTWERPAK